MRNISSFVGEELREIGRDGIRKYAWTWEVEQWTEVRQRAGIGERAEEVRDKFKCQELNISPSSGLNTRRLKTRAIPVSPPVVPPRYSSFLLDRVARVDRLANDEESDSEVVNSN